MSDITISDAIDFMDNALVKIGFTATNARHISEVIMDGELRGHADHGFYYLPWIFRSHTAGGFSTDAQQTVSKDSASAITIDGGGGYGVLAMNAATDHAISKAEKSGIAFGIASNSANLIALAPFVQRAADRGFIAMAGSGIHARAMPPPGGLTPIWATQPFAFAAPTGEYHPFVLDMATSAMSGAKVMEARDKGERVPIGMIEDAEGNPLTDPSEFKEGETLFLPMGGIKGFGLAMMVDILAVVLSGADLNSADFGHFIMVMDVERFMPRDEFERRMDENIDRMKSSRKRPGVDEIFYAGEQGQRRMSKLRSENRIPVSDSSWEAFKWVSGETGIPVPNPI